MTIQEAREYALSLPEATEAPHFERTSFRVSGRIFATAPADGASLNVFVAEESARAAVAELPHAFELLWWGKRLVGVRIRLEGAEQPEVIELLEEAWTKAAPKSLHLVARQEDGEHVAIQAKENTGSDLRTDPL